MIRQNTILIAVLAISLVTIGSAHAYEQAGHDLKTRAYDVIPNQDLVMKYYNTISQNGHDFQDVGSLAQPMPLTTGITNEHEPDFQGFCDEGYYDDGSDNPTYNTFCYFWTESSDGYANYLGLNAYNDMGDTMNIYAFQDPYDPMLATGAIFTIWEDGEEQPLARYNLAGSGHVLGIKLTDSQFDPKCYYVSVIYVTERAVEDHAWNSTDFCVVSGQDQLPDPRVTSLEETVADMRTVISSFEEMVADITARIITLETDMPMPDPEPEQATGIKGKVYTDTNDNSKLDSKESGVSGMTVITVNVADFADVNKTTTNENGDYSFELDIGTYLVQVESTPSFAYISVIDGSIVVQNLGI